MEHVKPFRIAETLVLCLAVVFVIMGTYAKSFGDPAYSRLATVYSLTEDGTWYIDRPLDQEANRFEQGTIDKVQVNGRILSSKPPVLPLLMTGEYVVLRALFGLDLNDPEDTNEIIRLLTMTLVGVPYILTLVFFLKTLYMVVEDPLARLVLFFCAAFCTQLWGYSININNHVPGACLTVIAVYIALGIVLGGQAPTAWRFFAFGFCGGLVPTIDTPATIFVFLAGVALLVKHPGKTLLWTGLGAVVPLGVHAGIMYATTGSPLPVQTREELYLYRGSYWRHPIQIDALNEPKSTYLFHMTVGRNGLFALFPILLVGPAALVRALLRRDMPYRGPILVGGLGFLILTLYYLFRTNNYGGEAYGFRWYIVAMPMLLLMGAPLLATVRRRWEWIFVGLLIGVSFYSAWECTQSPWAANGEWTDRFFGPSYYYK